MKTKKELHENYCSAKYNALKINARNVATTNIGHNFEVKKYNLESSTV